MQHIDNVVANLPFVDDTMMYMSSKKYKWMIWSFPDGSLLDDIEKSIRKHARKDWKHVSPLNDEDVRRSALLVHEQIAGRIYYDWNGHIQFHDNGKALSAKVHIPMVNFDAPTSNDRFTMSKTGIIVDEHGSTKDVLKTQISAILREYADVAEMYCAGGLVEAAKLHDSRIKLEKARAERKAADAARIEAQRKKKAERAAEKKRRDLLLAQDDGSGVGSLVMSTNEPFTLCKNEAKTAMATMAKKTSQETSLDEDSTLEEWLDWFHEWERTCVTTDIVDDHILLTFAWEGKLPELSRDVAIDSLYDELMALAPWLHSGSMTVNDDGHMSFITISDGIMVTSNTQEDVQENAIKTDEPASIVEKTA